MVVEEAPGAHAMPLFMDIHKLQEATTPDAVASAHLADLRLQDKYQVRYLSYWFNEDARRIFCLVQAPSAAAAAAVHREAHGGVADEIIEVEERTVNALLGSADTNLAGAVLQPGGSAIDTGFRTVMFTDMEDSTTMTQRLGDAEALKLLHAHDAIVRDALASRGGRQVKHTGDGIMAVFLSAFSAVDCAIAIQRALHLHNQQGVGPPIRVRVGLSAGEPVEDDGDLFGATVQLAARACAHARPGQILVSNVVAELCIGKLFTFVDLGELLVKGFERPIRFHEVALQGGS
jgi:class 3 adenylate cyclase